MLDAVQQHSPHVVVIDELRDTEEIQWTKTIAKQGVVVLASARSASLTQLLQNQVMKTLLSSETESDDLKGKEPHTFEILIEIGDDGQWHIHEDPASAVEAAINGHPTKGRLFVPYTGPHITRRHTIP